MTAMAQASRRKLVTSLLVHALLSLVHVSADVITTDICAGVRPEVAITCKKCANHDLAMCCADSGVFQQCLRSITNTTSDKHNVLEEENAADDVDKRARPFLGKRSEELESQLEADLLAQQQQFNADSLKRARPFLGKRSEAGDVEQYDEKRARPFLGKRTQDNEQYFSSEDLNSLEKRARPLLGKREQQELLRFGAYKRPRPFLGKRIIDGEEALGMEQDKRSKARPFLGKRSVDEQATISRVKRARPFLGKRARPFLGKRGGVSDEWVAEHLFKLHPELLLLQSSEHKRARPFLG
jgi:hypothetical protein